MFAHMGIVFAWAVTVVAAFGLGWALGEDRAWTNATLTPNERRALYGLPPIEPPPGARGYRPEPPTGRPSGEAPPPPPSPRLNAHLPPAWAAEAERAMGPPPGEPCALCGEPWPHGHTAEQLAEWKARGGAIGPAEAPPASKC